MYTIYRSPACLAHHGVVGMKWGIRRYQPYPKGYSGSGKEVGIAARMGIRTKRDVKKYQKKLVKRAGYSVSGMYQQKGLSEKYDAKARQIISKEKNISSEKTSKFDDNELRNLAKSLPDKSKAKVIDYINKKNDASKNAMILENRAKYDIEAAESFTKEALDKYGDMNLRNVPTNMLEGSKRYSNQILKSRLGGGVIGYYGAANAANVAILAASSSGAWPVAYGIASAGFPIVGAGALGGAAVANAITRSARKNYVEEILKNPTAYMPDEHKR